MITYSFFHTYIFFLIRLANPQQVDRHAAAAIQFSLRGAGGLAGLPGQLVPVSHHHHSHLPGHEMSLRLLQSQEVLGKSAGQEIQTPPVRLFPGQRKANLGNIPGQGSIIIFHF